MNRIKNWILDLYTVSISELKYLTQIKKETESKKEKYRINQLMYFNVMVMLIFSVLLLLSVSYILLSFISLVLISCMYYNCANDDACKSNAK